MATTEEKKNGIELIKGEDGSQILFISDPANCSMNETSICSDDFFVALESFLHENPNNKITFLGDYFDKEGQKNVIIKILKLYDKYNSKEEKKRVYITE